MNIYPYRSKGTPPLSNWEDFLNSSAPVGSIGNYYTVAFSTVVPNPTDRSSAVQKVPAITDGGGGVL